MDMVNPALLQSYHLGVGLGIVVLSTLVLFPGTKSPPLVTNNSNNESDNDDIAATTGITTSNTTNDSATADISPNVLPSKNVSSASTRQKRIHQASQQNDGHDDGESTPNNFLTPHRRLNWFVYILMYVVIIFVFIHSYCNHSKAQKDLPRYRKQLQHPSTLLKLAFQAYFPKEASVLFAPSISKSNKEK